MYLILVAIKHFMPFCKLKTNHIFQLLLFVIVEFLVMLKFRSILQSFTFLVHLLVYFHNDFHPNFDFIHNLECLSDIMSFMTSKKCTRVTTSYLTLDAYKLLRFAMVRAYFGLLLILVKLSLCNLDHIVLKTNLL